MSNKSGLKTKRYGWACHTCEIWRASNPNEQACPVCSVRAVIADEGDVSKYRYIPDYSAALQSYQPGTWYKANTVDEVQAFYMSRLTAIREAAREKGYAIGLHGSTRRDFDLIAMPWVENPAGKDELAIAIQHAACGISYEPESMTKQWEQKPSGRWAVSLPICWTELDKPSAGHIDLSVITEQSPQCTVNDESAWLIECEDAAYDILYLYYDDGWFQWTPDVNKALRLARREDAEILAAEAPDDHTVHINEHSWPS